MKVFSMKKLLTLIVFVVYSAIGVGVIYLYIRGAGYFFDWIASLWLSESIEFAIVLLWYGLSVLLATLFMVGFLNLLSRIIDGKPIEYENTEEDDSICEDVMVRTVNSVVNNMNNF